MDEVPMTWVVRADRGALLGTFHEAGVVAVRGGNAQGQITSDLAGQDRNGISELVREAGLTGHYTRMLDDFVNRMAPGDRILVPGRTVGIRAEDRQVLVGSVSGEYAYRVDGPVPQMPHTRDVRWDGLRRRDELEESVDLSNRLTVYAAARV